MTDPIVTKIDIAKVTSAYSGRPGCQCGCMGNYTDKPASIKRIVNNMFRKAKEAGEQVYIDSNGIVYCRDDADPRRGNRGFQYAIYFDKR